MILTFYDPENYCVIDFHVYQEVVGFRPKYLTPERYVRLLTKLREEARKWNLKVRDVEKAYFTINVKPHISLNLHMFFDFSCDGHSVLLETFCQPFWLAIGFKTRTKSLVL